MCTPAVERNLEALALGLCLGSPVLLEGPPGSGKSALIEHLAALTGNAQGAPAAGVVAARTASALCAWCRLCPPCSIAPHLILQ